MRLSYNRRKKRSAAVHIVTNKCVFSNFLKTGKVKVPSLRSVGRLFQATGPATEKPRDPTVTVLVGGMRRSPAAAERSWEWPAWRGKRDTEFGQVCWCSIVRTFVNSTAQFKFDSLWERKPVEPNTHQTWETLARPGSSRTSLAEARRMDWSLLSWYCGRPARVPLQ